ncbi:aldolase [Cohnella hashimotonis]|uniref:Aldolase n=1 Tax=Cohnella hashimotonis TaxID=2826895 RepID=A0ABT6TJB4_9BACL|nr:aldolase [Cohnella hashimotonis]MDI4646938.1 aldolase [Cohnella hashimotonis]
MIDAALAERTATGMVYRAFGLDMASTIPLPELPPAGAGRTAGMPDVTIDTADPVPLREELEASGSNFSLTREGSRFLFLIPDTAVYCIDEGRHIAVAPLPGADPEKVRVYLLGTCFGALLLIRGLLPLHGSAVVIGDRAYAFVGDSGAGKSTLAAALVGMGHRLLSDDVVAVAAGVDGRSYVMPAYPQQKLWRESLDGLGMQAAPYRTIYRETEKFAVPLVGGFGSDPVPLAGVLELGRSEGTQIGVSRMPVLERLRVMLQHTYRQALIPRLGLVDWHFRAASGIASGITVGRLFRPSAGFTARELAKTMIQFDKGGLPV